MSELKIAVDAHAIGRRQTGNEVYVRSLLEHYSRLGPEADFVVYTSCEEGSAWTPRGFRRRRVSKNPFVRLGVELGRRIDEDRPDLIHVQYTAPLRCGAPIVVTIHDVSYLDRPDCLPRWRAEQFRLTVRRTVRRAAKIVTVSEFSRGRIAEAYGLAPADIAVTPLAAQSRFRPMNREQAISETRSKLGMERPFLLNVGDLHPRKNQIGLIRAFAELLREQPQLPHALVMAGKHPWFALRVIEEVKKSGLSDRIVMTNFVDDDFLPTLYNAADLFVFPSFYEGFGLPAIEAMACGRPVACSDATALPEVVDGAAVLFSPNSIGDQMRAMRDVLLDAELASRLERLSLQRAKFCDWRDTARKTIDVYAEVSEQRQRAAPRKELVLS